MAFYYADLMGGVKYVAVANCERRSRCQFVAVIVFFSLSMNSDSAGLSAAIEGVSQAPLMLNMILL